MSTTGLPVFDETLHLTNSWLKDLMERLHTDDRHYAYRALRAVLHAIRDELQPELAAHLAAQLPLLVRGFYYEGWQPARTPSRDRSLEDFFQAIRTGMHGDPEPDVARLSGAVFDLLMARLSYGELEKVVRALPRDIRELSGIRA
jgi:Uncharacterized conserved protein